MMDHRKNDLNLIQYRVYARLSNYFFTVFTAALPSESSKCSSTLTTLHFSNKSIFASSLTLSSLIFRTVNRFEKY